jgi:hypothetical protein
MKRILLTAAVLTAIAGGGFALAQAPAAKPDDHAAHEHPGGMMMGGGMMGGGMCPMMGGGMGMMGGGMGGMGMMGGAKTKIDVKKIDKGVTITFTSTDAPTAARLQKMAEAMRLMHEAMTQ